MGHLYLVRHAQASFGADDYDQLSPLGMKQSQRLGEYFHGKGLKFDAVYTGTLRRHGQTLQGISEGMQWTPEAVQRLPGLNEYDSEAVLATVHPGKLQKPDSPEMYRNHFRLLRDGLLGWMEGRSQPAGMPSYADFVQGIVDALDRVRREHDGNVLMVSSGGPISNVVTHVLGAPAATSIELNLRIRNTAINEFAFNPKRHTLQTFNTLPHLDHADYAKWITYT